MADEQPDTNATPKSKAASKADGFNAPIENFGEGSVPDHIHPDTLMAKGLDPETKQVVSVSLAVLQHQHGEEAGLKLYSRIARAGGFFDPNSEPSGGHYFPDLQLEGMNADARAKVDAILNEK